MAKYTVAFENKTIRSIHPAGQEVPLTENTTDERTGDTIIATIDAANDNEAREKAERLETELRTGRTKEDLTGMGF